MDSRVLKDLLNNPNSIPTYLKQLWSKENGTPQFYINVLEQCYQIIIGSTDLTNVEPFFKNLKDQGLLQFGTCDVTWNFGDTAYKCKTCQLDPTTAMCIACFNAGDHKGHDYALQSVAGGFCDCGDPSSFNINGKHRGWLTDSDVATIAILAVAS
ncbi:hypothetical protein PPL_01442 [Heterostelium album PN500]|uniref:E3 ubiquitin-protein ligase n=1 Tax=Heterostelium pallidum (strain ATCC 26659 / Pp 5 / PN500) TaxID=670386 RepID=D3AZA2_HETP5|nr:hypothetical protein PPL_01442 [Heterostelium album PN500]EFA85485.1 hypothetical protein PPL_01442 [Heterostelium album PN500]|eukprot:XP_020437593.1 hypothetical protein PPL_01442 [Heterostelium album PN500]